MKTLKIVLATIFAIAIAFVLTVLILASIHGVSFTEEISNWFAKGEATDTVENVETCVRLLKL